VESQAEADLRRARGHTGWEEAAVAWSVCASIHREYCKGQDPFYKTRQSDFTRHENAARTMAKEGSEEMILRKVIKSEYVGASRYTGYVDKSIRLTFECGHDVTHKASNYNGVGKSVPERARCRDCEHLARGGTIIRGGVPDDFKEIVKRFGPAFKALANK
jgi:hypothetical protein